MTLADDCESKCEVLFARVLDLVDALSQIVNLLTPLIDTRAFESRKIAQIALGEDILTLFAKYKLGQELVEWASHNYMECELEGDDCECRFCNAPVDWIHDPDGPSEFSQKAVCEHKADCLHLRAKMIVEKGVR